MPFTDGNMIEQAIHFVTLALRNLDLTAEALPDGELDLGDTPDRIVRMWLELTRTVGTKLPKITTFETKHDEMLVLTGIPFVSLCSHHFVPFRGVAHIGYIPNESLVGISKPARILDFYANQPQVQERLTAQVADRIQERIKPLGVGVILKAEHMCITCRGAKKPGTLFTTSAMRGLFREDASVKQEFLTMIGD